LNSEVDLEVLDTAADGQELILKVKELGPDLVIADYNLPKNSRMFTFQRINQEFNIPILMIIGKDNIPDDFILKSRMVGVYDYVGLANQSRFPQFRKIREEIVAKARALIDIKQYQESSEKGFSLPHLTDNVSQKTIATGEKQLSSLVVIGASTGGTKAIEAIIKNLSINLRAAVLIAIHLPEKFTRTFAQRLKNQTSLKVVEGRTGTPLEAGKIVIAPGGKNMVINRYLSLKTDLRVDFLEGAFDEFDCPSVDILMKSVAKVAGPQTLGVILTGMGKDGTAGTKAIINKGGETIAQDEASSVIFGMAKSAIERGNITKVLGLNQIPDYINRFAEYHQI
jgi:two-component system chemotaxis response regulator CheB